MEKLLKDFIRFMADGLNIDFLSRPRLNTYTNTECLCNIVKSFPKPHIIY